MELGACGQRPDVCLEGTGDVNVQADVDARCHAERDRFDRLFGVAVGHDDNTGVGSATPG